MLKKKAGIQRKRMAGKNVVGSHKEMTAVINNLKESRILNKSVQTLSLEESYATKLLDLNSKILRFQFSRLKANVGKVKSHLTPEEIAAMRVMELEGKFKPEHPVVPSSNRSKITAASKRLKLNGYQRALSAQARLEKQKLSNSSLNTSSKECKEEEGAALSTPGRRSATAIPEENPTISCYHNGLATSCEDIRDKENKRTHYFKTAKILEKIALSQKSRKGINHKTSYSCHDSKYADSSQGIGDVFGPNPYESRRRTFLEAESQNFSLLSLKQNEFIGKTKRFAETNPCNLEMRPEETEEVIHSIDSMAKRPGSSKTKMRNSKPSIDASLPRQNSEMRKIRYLRISESLVDYSGFNTLAKDQYGSTDQWRNLTNKNRVSFKQAVAL